MIARNILNIYVDILQNIAYSVSNMWRFHGSVCSCFYIRYWRERIYVEEFSRMEMERNQFAVSVKDGYLHQAGKRVNGVISVATSALMRCWNEPSLGPACNFRVQRVDWLLMVRSQQDKSRCVHACGNYCRKPSVPYEQASGRTSERTNEQMNERGLIEPGNLRRWPAVSRRCQGDQQ